MNVCHLWSVNAVRVMLTFTGTGKSITGAHIAYAFALLNRERRRSEAEADEPVEQTTVYKPSSLPPLKCVLYCGPSNPSVDVVLGKQWQASFLSLICNYTCTHNACNNVI